MATALDMRKKNPFGGNTFDYAAITVGVEAGNVINVAVRLQTARRKNIAVRGIVTCYLSDVNTGAGITATAPGTSVAIGTNGVIIEEFVTKKKWQIVTDAQGRFDLNIAESGTPTWYLVMVMPDGSIQVSGAITFV
jgi:hypothetical protein